MSVPRDLKEAIFEGRRRHREILNDRIEEKKRQDRIKREEIVRRAGIIARKYQESHYLFQQVVEALENGRTSFEIFGDEAHEEAIKIFTGFRTHGVCGNKILVSWIDPDTGLDSLLPAHKAA